MYYILKKLPRRTYRPAGNKNNYSITTHSVPTLQRIQKSFPLNNPARPTPNPVQLRLCLFRLLLQLLVFLAISKALFPFTHEAEAQTNGALELQDSDTIKSRNTAIIPSISARRNPLHRPLEIWLEALTKIGWK